MRRVSTWAHAALAVMLLALATGTGGASGQAPAEPDAAAMRLSEAKIADELLPRLTQAEAVSVIIHLADQSSLETTRALRASYAARLEEIGGQLRALALRHHAPLPGGATREQVREAAQQEHAALMAAEGEQVRRLTAEAKALRLHLRDRVVAAVRAVIRPQQERVAGLIHERGGSVTYAYTVVNAVAARVPGAAIASIAAQPEVAYIVEDARLSLHLNTGPYSIRANTFWSNGVTGASSIPAIVDTGVDTTHPAIAAITWTSRTFHAGAQTQSDYDDSTATDDLQGHGTHVSGIVVSRDPVYRGVSRGSVNAINLKAGYRTSDNSGSLILSDVMASVDWALTTSAVRPDVFNFSAGLLTSEDDSSFTRFWDAVVDDADAFTTPVVVAAGNDGPSLATIGDPATGYNLLAVAATYDGDTIGRGDDTMAEFSSRGPTVAGRKKPDVAAPGARITSLSNEWEGNNPDFVPLDGTSMAAPHVAGAVALLHDAGITDPLRQKALLINGAEDRGDAGWDPAWGWGYLDLWYAYFHRNFSLVGAVGPAGGANAVRLYRTDGVAGAKTTLTWHRHVNYNGAGLPTTHFPLSNLDLRLYSETNNALVSSSLSSIDNVEQVASDRTGSQVIKVKTVDTTLPVSPEPFALAAQAALTPVAGPSMSVSSQPTYNALEGYNFTVNVTLANDGDLDAHTCGVALSLPAGITLVSGGNPQLLGTIQKGSSKQAEWTLRADSIGTYPIGVTGGSSSYGELWLAAGAFEAIVVGGRGDVDLSGAVNAADAMVCLRMSVGLPIAYPANPDPHGPPYLPEEIVRADVNADGVVDAADGVLILRLAVGLGIPAASSPAATTAGGSVSIPSATARAGARISLPVIVEAGLAGASLTIGYDPDVLQGVQVRAGAAARGYLLAHNVTAGEVRVSLANADFAPDVSGSLLTITATIAGDAAPGTATSLTFIKATAHDAAGRGAAMATRDGVITISGPPPEDDLPRPGPGPGPAPGGGRGPRPIGDAGNTVPRATPPAGSGAGGPMVVPAIADWQVGAPTAPGADAVMRGGDESPAEAPGREQEDGAAGERAEGPQLADVPASSPERECIRAVVEAGIMELSDAKQGLFRPQAAVTRREMAAALCRAAGWKELRRKQPTFSDVPADDPGLGWIERLASRVTWSAAVGETAGGKLRPGDAASRGEVAELLALVRAWAPRADGRPEEADAATGDLERSADDGARATRVDRPTAACTRGELAALICASGLHQHHRAQAGEESK